MAAVRGAAPQGGGAVIVISSHLSPIVAWQAQLAHISIYVVKWLGNLDGQDRRYYWGAAQLPAGAQHGPRAFGARGAPPQTGGCE